MTKLAVFDPGKFEIAPVTDRPTEKQTASDRIFVKDGKIQARGQGTDKIEVIILSWIFTNMHTTVPFVPNKLTPQECFAVGFNEDTLAPHSASPNPQHENCMDCWANAFGSNPRGGKACDNRRLLAVMTPEDQEEILYLAIAPTSLKNWKNYVNKFKVAGTDQSYPLWVTSTEISLTEVSGDRYKFVFEPGEPVKKKYAKKLEALEATAKEQLAKFIPPVAETKKKKKKGKRVAPIRS